MARHNTPFGYIAGPHYVYVIYAWVKNMILEPIYVGRGRGWRARTYYNLRRYLVPSHNLGLNARLAKIRQAGQDAPIFTHDCGGDLRRAKSLEKWLIRKHGRLDLRTGSLYNRNAGG
jgi:hypothetical protein